MSKFRQIDTAPYGREVEVRCGRKWFPAILVKDGSMTEDEAPCDQWQATTDSFPRNWSDGACWASNADGNMSDQPEEWRHLRARATGAA
ncbi:MAG: hypothetical protein J7500_15530 [Sphingomonas sp.]|uniref:hypothetical protein n=1 Tax=Sphingomonas sp. TaxID=28214 RepID=UPI001B11AA66|nr:hypothetical protein [Sphingomonas sp.]MBO9624118.1 hypothetical protein [Sphingomonas sp.]